MEKIEDIRYQQKLTLSQQSYLESIIGNHFFTTNHNNKINDTGEEDNINTNMLPLSLSNVNRDHCSIIQQRCVPFMQNDYSNLESPNQLNSYSFINEVNHSVYCHSNGNDVYNDCLTSAPIITTNSNSHDHNHQNYHASTSTPRFIHESVWHDRNGGYIVDNSSFCTGIPSSPSSSSLSSSMIVPCSTVRTTTESQIDYVDSAYLTSKLIKSSSTNSSQQINTGIELMDNIFENSPILQNNPNNGNPKYRRNSSKLSSTIRKEHQREQDKNRTRTLNVAFCRLRSCLPEIPKDTKLTKIRTLRYAITYIRQLMDLIHQTDSMNSSAMMFDTGLNSLKMESEHDQSLMKDSGYLSFMDR
uniref:Putative dhand n=1 Tax=Schistosoma mansoni TaxID=6183 RepID=A0A3Q0KGS2_SCHMA